MEDFVVIIDFSEGATKAWVEANFEPIGGESSSLISLRTGTKYTKINETLVEF